MRVKCRCGKFISVSLQTHGDLIESGNPKYIGEGKCDCGRDVEVYASLYFPSKLKKEKVDNFMDKQSTEICQYYEKGDCTYGEKCGEYAPKCEDIILINRCHMKEK